MNKPLNWFEIPTNNLDKSKSFYESVFGIQMKTQAMGPTTLAVFPYDRDTSTGGALIQGPGYEPASAGAILYLNAGESVDPLIERALKLGGTLALPKTALPPGMGSFAHILDLDGNRIGLHGAQ